MDRSMRYPSDFPAESRAAVAAEKLRAGRDFDVARKNSRWTQYGASPELQAELRRYILRPFTVFVSEACKLGRKGIWHVDRIRKEAFQFLRLSTIDATYSKGYDKADRRFGQDWISNWGGSIQPEVMRLFEQSGEWQQFQDALLEVAECQCGKVSYVEEDAGDAVAEVTHDSTQSERTGGTSSGAEGIATPKITSATTEGEPDRPALVDTFLRRCNREPDIGFRVMRKHIWLAAGHARARQFQYWQEKSNKASEADDRVFRRIVALSPAEFIPLLIKMEITPSTS